MVCHKTADKSEGSDKQTHAYDDRITLMESYPTTKKIIEDLNAMREHWKPAKTDRSQRNQRAWYDVDEASVYCVSWSIAITAKGPGWIMAAARRCGWEETDVAAKRWLALRIGSVPAECAATGCAIPKYAKDTLPEKSK